MTQNALQDVLDRPRSIAARRALAREWRDTNDPRAELLEKELAVLDGLWFADECRARERIRELLEEHRREWAGPLADLVSGYSYGLGLVDTVRTSGNNFVDRGAELVRMAPGLPVHVGPELSARRALQELHGRPGAGTPG